ncbi:MAG: hypothetical protein AAF570_14165 [Bacteroidota bacterium]
MSEESKRPYARRSRNWEFRGRHTIATRPDTDEALQDYFRTAREQKKQMIAEQVGSATHIAAYAGAGGTGAPWYSIGPRNIFGRVRCLAVDPNDDEIVYAGAASGGVWKTENGGDTWRSIFDEEDVLVIGAIAVAPQNANRIYIGTGECVGSNMPNDIVTYPGDGTYVTINGGQTWTRASTNSSRCQRILVDHTNQNRALLAGNRGLEVTTNGGSTWNWHPDTNFQYVEISDMLRDPVDPNVIYLTTYDPYISAGEPLGHGAIWISTDNGLTFSQSSLPGLPTTKYLRLGAGKDVNNPQNSQAYIRDEQVLFQSNDFGSTWTRLSDPITNQQLFPTRSHYYTNSFTTNPNKGHEILYGGQHQGVHMFNLNLGNWNMGALAMNIVYYDTHQFAWAPSNPNRVYICGDGGVYRSDDCGCGWEEVSDGLMIPPHHNIA